MGYIWILLGYCWDTFGIIWDSFGKLLEYFWDTTTIYTRLGRLTGFACKSFSFVYPHSILDSKAICRQFQVVPQILYLTPPYILKHFTWAPQSKLACGHHHRASWPWALCPLPITILKCGASLSAGGYVLPLRLKKRIF